MAPRTASPTSSASGTKKDTQKYYIKTAAPKISISDSFHENKKKFKQYIIYIKLYIWADRMKFQK